MSDLSGLYKEEWKKIENVKTYPHYLRKVVLIEAPEFISKVMSADQKEVKELVNSIYKGDAYILKNAVSAELVEEIKDKAIEWGKTKNDEFHHMLDGVGSYRFTNYGNHKPEGGYTEVVHSSVFFRWDDQLDLFNHFDKLWGAFKTLSGQDIGAFKNNKPSDGIIDRITLMHYPLNYGKVTDHYDSPRTQKLLLGGIFSQIGEDYDWGENGFYLIDKNGRRHFLENISKKGDLICSYPAMYHGVSVIKKQGVDTGIEEGWLHNKEGRFYLQCFSAESHEVKNREYTKAIKDEAGHGPVANYIGDYEEQ